MNKIGQAILEYAVLLAIVAAAFMAMSYYAKTAVQGKIYAMEGMVTAKGNQTPSSWYSSSFSW
jgi:uncharacterized protein (UPF0333 family)